MCVWGGCCICLLFELKGCIVFVLFIVRIGLCNDILWIFDYFTLENKYSHFNE